MIRSEFRINIVRSRCVIIPVALTYD